MGKVTKVTTVCTCDICGKECSDNEHTIDVTTGYNLNGRCYMYGTLYAYVPYGTTQGVVCRECKLSLLEQYIKTERLKHEIK